MWWLPPPWTCPLPAQARWPLSHTIYPNSQVLITKDFPFLSSSQTVTSEVRSVSKRISVKNSSKESGQTNLSIQCSRLSWKSSTLFLPPVETISVFPSRVKWSGAAPNVIIKGHVFVFHPDTFLWLNRVVMPTFSHKNSYNSDFKKNLLYKIFSAVSSLHYPHTQNLNSKQIKEINVQKRT